MLGTSWECHKVREFALWPMGDFLPVLDHTPLYNCNCTFESSGLTIVLVGFRVVSPRTV